MPVPVPPPRTATPSPEGDLFGRLLPPDLLNALDPRAPQAVYTPWVILWLLLSQRLHGDASLSDAVAELVLRFPPGALPDCKRARERTLSANSGAFSRARTRRAPPALAWAADPVSHPLAAAHPPTWHGRRAFLIDGSTVTLAPTQALQAAFPPARNQHGRSHWPVLHLAVAHELASGLALPPEYGPMYGPQAVSELTLARRLLPRLPPQSLLVADRNFGIFAFADAAVQAGHGVLLRLTGKRFQALRRRAQSVGDGKWVLRWQPSRWDREAHPDLPAGAEVRGWLYEVRVSQRLTLGLFATEDGTGAEMAAQYRFRWGVERDLRDLKGTLVLDQISGQSAAMVAKELAVALVAYNLASQVRRTAAARLQLQPRQLSFAGVWGLLKAFLAGAAEPKTQEQLQGEFERLLRAAGQRKLPRRRTGRRYPREVIPRRRKFPERKRTLGAAFT